MNILWYFVVFILLILFILFIRYEIKIDTDNESQCIDVINKLINIQFNNSKWAKNKMFELEEQKYINNISETTKNVNGGIGNKLVVTSGNTNKIYLQNKDGEELRCQYCNTKHNNVEKSCSACGAPL
jgi:hypothetical protein